MAAPWIKVTYPMGSPGARVMTIDGAGAGTGCCAGFMPSTHPRWSASGPFFGVGYDLRGPAEDFAFFFQAAPPPEAIAPEGPIQEPADEGFPAPQVAVPERRDQIDSLADAYAWVYAGWRGALSLRDRMSGRDADCWDAVARGYRNLMLMFHEDFDADAIRQEIARVEGQSACRRPSTVPAPAPVPGPAPEPAPGPAAAAPRRIWPWALAALGLLAVGGGALYYGSR